MKKKIELEVVVDIVCPWCYVGKTTLLKAMDSLKDQIEFDVRILPFQLDPDVPAEGVPRSEYLTKKFGGGERFAEAELRVIQAAKNAGAEMHFEKIQMQINTMDCHRLIWLAGKDGKQLAATNELYKAYYEEGLDLSRKANLASVMARLGYEAPVIQTFLDSDQGIREVETLIGEVYSFGISGVPFFILNREVGISGAQPLEVFLQAFQEV
ncbi:DsbA family oxidoreductase [Bdellovibrio bacteriovorus]|uniref:DsbA family oxidoreductase n=1 Tax=Bdellovibrio bacteriovorus TaxID=959 RepID=UPI0021D09E68|nr:DsbA family oxidoreductase [Bdellovibrio bacteriovorus]UXR66041.1 DsbA family oxidoreductase [Bdellovibrio bacteriovorus]